MIFPLKNIRCNQAETLETHTLHINDKSTVESSSLAPWVVVYDH